MGDGGPGVKLIGAKVCGLLQGLLLGVVCEGAFIMGANVEPGNALGPKVKK